MAGSASPGEIQFDEILRAEIDAINQRRAALERPTLNADDYLGPNGKVLDAVGLALSGGGIRSAAFALGVLQAINHNRALCNIDYLSTVSGGGYMGSALSATMTCSEGKFLFGNAPAAGSGQPASEIADTPAVGHLRNYSNYLIPAGPRDVWTASAIVVRGLVANLAWVLPIVLLLAAMAVAATPSRSDLGCPSVFDLTLCSYFPLRIFLTSLLAGLLGLVLYYAWALYRSFLGADRLAEFRTRLPAIASVYLMLVCVILFFDTQAFITEGMFELSDGGLTAFDWLTKTLQTLAALAVPVAGVVVTFRQQIGDLLKAASSEASRSTQALAHVSKVAIWIAGAALPLLVLVAYTYLTYWGIINDQAPEPPAAAHAAKAEKAEQKWWAPRAGKEAADSWREPEKQTCSVKAGRETYPCCSYLRDRDPPDAMHTPQWLLNAASKLTNTVLCPIVLPLAVAEGKRVAAAADATNARTTHTAAVRQQQEGEPWQPMRWLMEHGVYRPMAFLYFFGGFVLLFIALLLRPNTNSLHGLYRDRLSKAFLFNPCETEAENVEKGKPSLDQGRDFPQLDNKRLSWLSPRHAPYHLINAALNIQGSDYANRRGRNADFFLFSPCHVGSDATGYARTAAFEKAAPDLTLATAMAISGAAVSSNMGSESVAALRISLALLNVRLGYWLKNPRYVASARPSRWHIGSWTTLYLWSEVTGRLYENSHDVYLTDGGHIENLGVYQLLKRRCKLIIVVDAEADLIMRFPSFITLQRYARIDLGIRIDMPWDDIRKTTNALMGFSTGSGGGAVAGPHAAIGTIDYGEGRAGTILYLKASLSGDENDYIRDYARRYPLFPHETTGDQFFSEEQFEVYRALGFHVAHGVFSGRDDICVADGAGAGRSKFKSDGNSAVTMVRESVTA